MPQENVEIVRRHIEAFLDDELRSFSFVDPYVVLDRPETRAASEKQAAVAPA